MRAGGSGIFILLLGLVLALGAAAPARAVNCSDIPNYTLDGFAGDVAPSQIQIDHNCTIRNYPGGLSTNFSFQNTSANPGPWLIIFDNVVHTGQMACDSVHDNKIWFVNGSSSAIQEGCQNLLIPVEKIEKQNPPGPATVTVGVPFTYQLIIPVLFDAATGSVVDYTGSPNDLHSVTVWDDLNATGVDLTYLSHVAYWRNSGTPVPHTFSNVGGVLTFDDFPIIPSAGQIVVEITAVLEDTPTNAPGTQFVNTAKWDFGRLIDGVFYEPLPGEWGISPPLTIAAPSLVVTKTGPATLGRTLNLGEWGEFTLDLHNTGLSGAWNATILDRLPDGPTGGMCNLTPEVLSAQVFAADGTTPVSPLLVQGTDYSFSYAPAPTCELTLSMLTPATSIGPDERLVITYRTQLDADTQDGVALTNVAGATQWFNGDSSNADRVTFNRTLTDGTVGVDDHQDAHTVTAELHGLFFEKTVADVSTGVDPTATAVPGDTLRYTLRLQATDAALSDLAIQDELGRLNASAVFVPGSLALVTVPSGADTSNTDPNGGVNGAGILDVRNLSVPANGEILIQFDITLDPALADGTVVLNQSQVVSTAGGVKLADSDDPNVNGQADPDVIGDEDPTRVVVEATPPSPLAKANTQATAAVGQEFSYRVTVPAAPHTVPLFDVRILDNLADSAADLEFVRVAKVSGSGSWTPANTGTTQDLVIEDAGAGIDIPAGEQVVLEVTVVLRDSSTNVAGLSFTNTAAFTYDLRNDDDTSQRLGGSGTTQPMTIVEPQLTLTKTGPAGMTIGTPETFTLDVQNVGGSPAWNATLTDLLPSTPSGGTCDTTPASVSAEVFASDGTTSVSGPLVAGADYATSFNGCLLTLSVLTDRGTIGPGQRLIVHYDSQLDNGSQDGASLTNIAGAVQWSSSEPSSAQRRTYSRVVTDGTVGVLDHEDAHTVVVALPGLVFEKTVVDETTGADPAVTAAPGDSLLYTLRLENPTDTALSDLAIVDDLGSLNSSTVYEPGTLTLVTVPGGADSSATDPSGGTNGTGLLDVRALSLPALGSLVVEFRVRLAPVIANGTLVTNQTQLRLGGGTLAVSDDPNVNGPAQPDVAGDEDPTRVTVVSAPRFRVEKVSADLTSDPNILLAGERLRYTLSVTNVGNADASDATLRDAVPANTRYVPGSTTLDGATVPDGAAGTSPLSAGLLIHAPGDPTPGVMRADVSGAGSNVATLVFDVDVDPAAVDGTVISNQGFVSAAAAGVFDQPSDDPRTAIVDDPTRDVVGSSPLLFAAKSVQLATDGGTPGIVDPGDVLQYTIEIFNTGVAPATAVVLRDAVPASTTYVGDSTTLNGLAVGQPDGGVLPLAAGVPISSSDLTPPLPGPGEGTINPGQSAVIGFRVQVDGAATPGTVISNQAFVSGDGLPVLPSDGDGNPATGPEPTVVVVGDAQQLSITKQVTVVGGGAALPGSELEYVVRVTNIAAVPAFSVAITDDLDASAPGQLTYVAGSATMNGATTGVSVLGSVITADYSDAYGALQPGEVVTLRFRASVDPGLAIGTTVTNEAVAGWSTGTARASVSVDLGGVPGVGLLQGSVWHDADFDRTQGGSELALSGWIVELRRNNVRVQSVITGDDGSYRISGLAPNDATADIYELRFSAPDAGPDTAALGIADSPFTNGLQQISNIVVTAGNNVQGLNLPIQPNGVVYDAIQRTAISGATLTLLGAASGAALPDVCFDDAAQQGQVTRGDGYYRFDLNFGDAACPSGGSYVIAVSPPGPTYESGYSQLIPPTSTPSGAAFSVPTCPAGGADAVPATPDYCEVQPSAFAPLQSVAARSPGTSYYVNLILDDSQVPGSSQIFNNHIPLDPVLANAVTISKTTPSSTVSRGQLVPYEITVNSELGADLTDLSIVDRFPAGFRYVEGSAQIDGVAVEPAIDGQELVWSGLGVGASASRQVRLLLAVGAGVSEGRYVNRAQVVSSLTGKAVSGEASASVAVVPDPTFDCTDVMGKVFNDVNGNGVQDPGEPGIAGVRLVTVRGLVATTDPYGRYHITCATVPNDNRGTNFLLKLDNRTLPSGFRLSTRPVQTLRATRGKALRFNYAASINRVVSLDISDPVFEPGSTELRPQWRPRIDRLLEELERAPSTLRLSYLADVEEEKLVERRLDSIEELIADAWKARAHDPLRIESEVFWRRGAPPDRSGGVVGGGR